MQAQEIIQHLQDIGTWVNWSKTRDVVLHGNPKIKVSKIGICWMVTNKVLKQAIEDNINFIITHENPFYQSTTSPDQIFYQSANRKKQLLDQHNICVYRCHDVWDKIPDIGVSDMWAKSIDLPFEPRNLTSFNSYAYFSPTTVRDIARKFAQALAPYGEDSVVIFGDPNQLISSIGIGTGAATYAPTILEKPVDAISVSDDGCMTYTDIQYCLDNDIPVIRVNHAQCEIAGLKELVPYIKNNFDIETIYLDEGYQTTTIY